MTLKTMESYLSKLIFLSFITICGYAKTNAQIAISVCADDNDFTISFDNKILPSYMQGSNGQFTYSIIFNPPPTPVLVGFNMFTAVNNVNGIFPNLSSLRSITVPVPQRIYPHHYTATLLLTDNTTQCSVNYHLQIDVLYPKTILQQKWNDVIGIVSTTYNGGYIVAENDAKYSYQWYHNGRLITAAEAEQRGSILYLGKGNTNNYRNLVVGDEYCVAITRSDGTTVRSCPHIAY